MQIEAPLSLNYSQCSNGLPIEPWTMVCGIPIDIEGKATKDSSDTAASSPDGWSLIHIYIVEPLYKGHSK